MRVSTSSVLFALPLLAAAAESPFEEYKAQFQNFLGNIGSYIPSPSKHDAAAAAASKDGDNKLHIFTSQNWRDTLYAPVKPTATKPEEWWVLITGGNKTCFGHCETVEGAFNETAAKFAKLPNTPHMGLLNCDDQPVLCNGWSAGAGSIWLFEMLPPPSPVDIYTRRLNLTTTTSKELVDLHASKSKDSFKLNENFFQPFNSWVGKNGLTIPVGYFFWAFGILPNWMFMLIVSFGSRRIMNRRMNNHMGGPPAPAT